jgi:hypothetical protein
VPWLVGGIAVAVVLLLATAAFAVVRLSADKPNAEANPPRDQGRPAQSAPGPPQFGSSSPAATPQPSGPMYTVDVDYCGKLDYTALGAWAMTKDKSEPPRKGGTGRSGSYKVTCSADFRNGGVGKFSNVTVYAEVYESVADAQEAYTFHLDFDRGRFDKDLTGYGDQSYGTYRTWTPGFKTSEYEVCLRAGNLFLTTHVSVSQDAFIPKETMEPKVGAEAKSVLALVPKA